MGSTAHKVAAAALAAALAIVLGLSGCSNSSTCTCPDEVEVVYPARTSPENVIEKLKLAYIYMDADAYVDCLADSFRFHLNSNDWGPLPETWNRAVEETIHRRMFASDSDVERVTLTLATANIEFEWNAGYSVWRYTESCDLRVTVSTGDVTYHATTPQLFVLEADEERTGSEDEVLWVIVEWHDIGDGDRPIEGSSWGTIKALYR
jgi:hypothetical protein